MNAKLRRQSLGTESDHASETTTTSNTYTRLYLGIELMLKRNSFTELSEFWISARYKYKTKHYLFKVFDVNVLSLVLANSVSTGSHTETTTMPIDYHPGYHDFVKIFICATFILGIRLHILSILAKLAKIGPKLSILYISYALNFFH